MSKQCKSEEQGFQSTTTHVANITKIDVTSSVKPTVTTKTNTYVPELVTATCFVLMVALTVLVVVYFIKKMKLKPKDPESSRHLSLASVEHSHGAADNDLDIVPKAESMTIIREGKPEEVLSLLPVQDHDAVSKNRVDSTRDRSKTRLMANVSVQYQVQQETGDTSGGMKNTRSAESDEELSISMWLRSTESLRMNNEVVDRQSSSSELNNAGETQEAYNAIKDKLPLMSWYAGCYIQGEQVVIHVRPDTDPEAAEAQLCGDVPRSLRRHIYLTGDVTI